MASRLRLKICGMKDPGNIRDVAALAPDYMGFIFYATSPRFVKAVETLPHVDSAIQKVFVFVNETTDRMARLAVAHEVKHLQLHGQESPDQCEELEAMGFHVIKAFSMHADFDFALLSGYESRVSYFLFDTKGLNPGGNAVAFDWRLLRKYHQRVPFFLSGGLRFENLSDIELLKDMNLHGLDLNSGVEDSPGYKNIEKIKDIQVLIQNLQEFHD